MFKKKIKEPAWKPGYYVGVYTATGLVAKTEYFDEHDDALILMDKTGYRLAENEWLEVGDTLVKVSAITHMKVEKTLPPPWGGMAF